MCGSDLSIQLSQMFYLGQNGCNTKIFWIFETESGVSKKTISKLFENFFLSFLSFTTGNNTWLALE